MFTRIPVAAHRAARQLHTTPCTRQIYDNILQTIGRTPVVSFNKLAPPGIKLYGKLEYFNPLHSVKDRLALAVVEAAEKSGALKPGQTVVEATSGNTGIALAMVCAQKGYPLIVTMAESFSIERRRLMRFLGAKVIVTPAPLRGTGMVRKASEIAKAVNGVQMFQFMNAANADFHANTTGPEILLDFAGKRLDYFVLGYGTGGTLLGCGRALRASRPDTKIVVSEPATAPLLTSGLPQEREADGNCSKSHPAWATHPIMGWTPDFIPLLAEQARSEKIYDELITVTGDEAMAASRNLARQEGVFVGVSAGASLASALKVAAKAPKGSSILCMIPDTAERYLSTPLFESSPADMNEEELSISRLTPYAQLPPPAPKA